MAETIRTPRPLGYTREIDPVIPGRSIVHGRTLNFEGLHHAVRRECGVVSGIVPCAYALGRFGPPLAGEWYVSGAIPAAYKAPQDLNSAYRVVVPLAARCRTAWFALTPDGRFTEDHL